MLAALCDIFGCGVEDLLTVTATDVRRKKAAASTATTARPERCRTEQIRAAPSGPCDPAMTIDPNRRSATARRHRVRDGALQVHQMRNDGQPATRGELARLIELCNSCFYAAMRTRGICPHLWA